MNDHIKTHIARCDICRSVDDRQQKETLHPHSIPNRPWAKVGVDLFQFDNKNYHITVDYYSNYWEIDFLPDTKSTTVIKKLKAHFARYGIPSTVVSDNGPQYSSQEFRRFSQLWEFEHKTSSPGYPQSNGKAESAVKTVKRLLHKAKASGQDPYLALLDHRNTPSQGLDTSPAQRLLSRRTRTLLPVKTSLLLPKVIPAEQALLSNQLRQCAYYNRSARDLDLLNRGDLVRVQPFQPHTKWRLGTVNKTIDSRSYEIEMDSGAVLRRNRRHLRRAHGVLQAVPTDIETVDPQDAQTDPVQPQPTPQNNSVPMTTRSGRIIRKPLRYKDFTT